MADGEAIVCLKAYPEILLFIVIEDVEQTREHIFKSDKNYRTCTTSVQLKQPATRQRK